MEWPTKDDERWQGRDEGNDTVQAVCVNMRSLRFCEMKSGGPYDGGVSALMSFAVRTEGGKFASPVTMILSPEDTVALVSLCVDAATPDPEEWGEEEDEHWAGE